LSIVDTSRMWVRGRLRPFMQSFACVLHRQGYNPHGARNQLRLMSHLGRWLQEEGLGTDDLLPANLERFLHARRLASPATAPATGAWHS
jgi:hypothetical protein